MSKFLKHMRIQIRTFIEIMTGLYELPGNIWADRCMLTLLNVLSRCIIVDRCVGNFVCIYLQLCAEGKLEGSNTTEFNEDRLASIVRSVYLRGDSTATALWKTLSLDFKHLVVM